jgi:methyl-accepting chemotaxis protein
MKKKLFKKSLKSAMILYITLIIVVVCAGLALISYNVSYSALADNINSSMLKIASQAANTISARYDANVQSLESLRSNSIFQDLQANKNDILQLLAKEKDEEGCLELLVADNNGNVLSTDETANVKDQDFYQKTLEGKNVITDPIISEDKHSMWFYISVPIYNQSGGVTGVLAIRRDASEISGMIADVTYADTGKAFMLNASGVTVAHSDLNLVLSKDNDFQNVNSDASLASLVGLEKKMVAGETGVGQYDYNGVVKYMAYCPIANTNWFLALAAPESEVFKSVTTLEWYILGASAIFLILSIVVAVFVARSITNPIQKIAHSASEIAKGNTDTQVKIHRKDEVGQLAATIDNEVRNAFINIEKAQTIAEKQSRYQNEQVDKLVVNLERLAKGELKCDMTVSEPDEDTKESYQLFKNISDNLHTGIDAIKGYVEEISDVLGELSEKNLNTGISKEYRGDFIALKNSINGIVESLNEIMTDLNSSADQVAAGTQQVSYGSQGISQGATEQASSIEELTSTISEVAEQTVKNAENANRANALTLEAKNNAVHGNEQMKAMQQAMTEINESSTNIGKIIKVIDDIAFQTNILALNAAVEAARAGVHGKGFAVVAEEVRNLAAKSADAAKQTTDLIEGSIRRAEAGTKIADETAEALSGIVSGVDNAAELVGSIASASNEQASAITQINNGIEQMNQVVQTNSATSEEQAAAAEELSSQAEMLKNMVGQFRLKAESTLVQKAAISATKETVKEKPQIQLADTDFGKY